MGSTHHEPIAIDPEALNEANAFWNHFTTAIKFGIGAVFVLLSLMAVFVA